MPASILYLSDRFPARDRAGVVSPFMAAAPVSVVLGSPRSGAPLAMDGISGLRGWQWMFLVEGARLDLEAGEGLRFVPEGRDGEERAIPCTTRKSSPPACRGRTRRST